MAAEALEFYEGLAGGNSRTYWLAHEAVYDEKVRAPVVGLLAELEPEFRPAGSCGPTATSGSAPTSRRPTVRTHCTIRANPRLPEACGCVLLSVVDTARVLGSRRKGRCCGDVAGSSSVIATAPGRTPLLGHAVQVMRRPVPFLTSLRAVRDVVRSYFGTSLPGINTVLAGVSAGRADGQHRDFAADMFALSTAVMVRTAGLSEAPAVSGTTGTPPPPQPSV